MKNKNKQKNQSKIQFFLLRKFLKMNISKRFISKITNARCCCRHYSQKSIAVKRKHHEKEDPKLIRNIGILAHIDAGMAYKF